MKKIILSAAFFLPVIAYAQTAEQIVEQYSAAMGGLETFNKVESARISGTMKSQGQSLPFIQQVLNNKGMRMDVTAMGRQVVNVYYSGKGWKINPFAGASAPTDVNGAELLSLRLQASLANNLMDYKARGHQVELAGSEEVEGVPVYKLKLTSKDDGKQTFYFIMKKDNLLVKSVSKREIAGTEYDAETFYSDIRDISGIKFCMHFIQKIDGKVFQEVTYDKVELGVPVDVKIFEKN